MFLDFDGSLAEIVARPELARPVDGAREAVAALVLRFRVVAVISGRSGRDVANLLAVEGVRYVGLYGMEGSAEPPSDLLARARHAASVVQEAWVEDKGASVAVHYRQAPETIAARAALLGALGPLADATGLELVEGKMVLELVPRDRPMKGGAVERIAEELRLEGALYAGDDVADLDAFAALERLSARGIAAVRVAVVGPETPDRLSAAADVLVDGPAGLVALLRELAD